MTEQLTLYGTMLELRLREEDACRNRAQAAEHELAQIREKIYELDRASDNIAKAARLAFVQSGGDQGRGYLRMKHKLRLDRALASTQLSAAKDLMQETRRAFTEAVRRRNELEKVRGASGLESSYYHEQLASRANDPRMVASV